MAENKVRFLRGTATEYANAVKDDDTFYYTTDDGKFYVGDKEITGGGVTVDNTLSDTSEHPVQNKVIKSALDGKLDTSFKGTANGLAELDFSGKVPTSQLPSYVDDVIEGYLYNSKFYKEPTHTTEIASEAGKIYIDLSNNKTYRWSGSAFVVVSETLALGTTSSTAYRGDRGLIAYNHSQSAHAPSNAEANVQSDWNVTDTSSDAYILNKPTKLSDFTNDAGFITSGEIEGGITYSLSKSGSTITLTGSDGTTSSVTDSNDNTKNTAGSTNTSNKIFLVGATSQATNPQTYSHDTAYVGTDGCLYSDSKKVVTTDDSRLSDARTPSAHNQASNTINAMTGYSKPSSTAAIATSDTLNAAIGKLEKALDGKQASGSYAAASHTHDDRYYTESEMNTKLSAKLDTSLKGAASGLAELDSSGKVPVSQLPSYVDDVLEYDKLASFPSTGETGKIYVATDTNKTYRWSGSGYTEISPSIALGETSSTAYRGDRGKIAYDHSQTAHAPSNAEANVQADWSVTDTSSDAYIKNKPTSLPANGGTASKANTLSTARTIQTNLGSTSGESFDGSKNVTPGVTGTLPIANGGTGATTASAALTALGAAASTHTHSAYVNQNAFSNITVGSTTVAADTTTDTLTLVGSNVTLTPDATNDKITIGITKSNVTSALGYTPPTSDTTYNNATTTVAGLMSAADKEKLDGIAKGANNYSLPTASSTTLGGVKTTSSVSSNSGYTACPIISGVPYYKDTKVTVDSSLSSTSTNPVQNKIVKKALDTKVESSILTAHTSNTDIHVTSSEKSSWNSKAELSDIPTSLPANGGNADTVGNKSIEDLMSYGMAFGDRTSEPHQITSGDLNNYHTAGCFLVPNATSAQAITNSPFTDAGYFLDIYSRNSTLTLQIAFTWSGLIKIRYSTNATTWTVWKNINTESAGDLALTASNFCLRNLSSGTAEATDANCPIGAWYGKHK